MKGHVMSLGTSTVLAGSSLPIRAEGSAVVSDILCIVHAMLLSSASLKFKSWLEHSRNLSRGITSTTMASEHEHGTARRLAEMAS